MKINNRGIRRKIVQFCRNCPKAADDDKLLISLIWEDEGWDYEDSLLNNLRRVSSPETIRRTRQMLVAEGEIKPSEVATERRYQEFKQARKVV